MLPLSLYIHIPWCIQKCPYCDFNSHKSPTHLPEIQYVQALLHDLDHDLQIMPARPITSIFIGGGTPSLLSEHAYALLFEGLHQRLEIQDHIEITLEANPNSVEQARFKAYRALGINRLSLGIQSFHEKHLKTLGRVHNSEEAKQAILAARQAGFERINLDLMYGLPEQSVSEGMEDLNLAVSYNPEHISWYQLTLEPNTVFYNQQPILPNEVLIDALEQKGQAYLATHQYKRYEISAYSKPNQEAQHNLNYWQFGDYYGIGAGAHGKLTSADYKNIYRTRKQRQPKRYLDINKPCLVEQKKLNPTDLIFEFMLNTTRLAQAIPYALLTKQTGLNIQALMPAIQEAVQLGLLKTTETHFQITPLGRRFTNDLQRLFLP